MNKEEALKEYREVQEELNKIKSGESIPDELTSRMVNSVIEASQHPELAELIKQEFKLKLKKQ